MKAPRIPIKRRIILSASLAGLSFILKEILGYAPVTVLLMLAVTALAGFPIFRKAFSALRYRIVGIDALVTLAVVGALFLGEYWEAAAVTFLFTFGDYLEARTIEKTRSSLKTLLALAPDRARVQRVGTEVELSPSELIVGDRVVVRPGEKIPADGTVLEGDAYVNQAPITGESLPVHKDTGSEVYSGTILESGYLIILSERVGEDTSFSRILHMVEDAQDRKAKTQKFLERFSRIYTPAIVAGAVLLYLLTRDLKLALTLLVIACPGALVISAPVSIVAGIGNGAKRGILVKGGDIMEKLGNIRAVAFDKTGTLTEGRPQVLHVEAFSMSEDELLRLAAIGESYSEHPLAQAILRKAAERKLVLDRKPEATELLVGRGLAFTLEGKNYRIGNKRLFAEQSVDVSAAEKILADQEKLGRTAVMVGDDRHVLGVVAVADAVRSDAPAMIARLRNLGIRHLVMLTGDNSRTAAAIAGELGLDEYRAELLPEGKVAAVEELRSRYGRIAMVGDGVNDAPALASADVGIALGGLGKDAAMETADVVLMSGALGQLSFALALSRATVRNMKQNIYFALAVAALLLAGVLVKSVNLSFGMMVHEASVLLVIVNAVRLLGYGRRRA